MKHLGLIGAILPLVLIGIGLIGWVLSVRNDVTDAVKQLNAIHTEIAAINERMDGERTIRTDLHMDQAEDLSGITNDLSDRISEIQTNLAVANDQMQTIMGDHMGFAEVLKELGEAGALPSGERRAYGGYGGN
jgi:predicted  nucleic acid-binding Zn-ribbon protein